MPMTPIGLAAAMETQLGVADPQSSAQIPLLATAIVTYIQTNAIVTTTDTIPALGLISPGGLTPAPVTGVANGTGTGTVV